MAAANFLKRINVVFFFVRIKDKQIHQIRIFATLEKLKYSFHIKQTFVRCCFMLRITDSLRHSN